MWQDCSRDGESTYDQPRAPMSFPSADVDDTSGYGPPRNRGFYDGNYGPPPGPPPSDYGRGYEPAYAPPPGPPGEYGWGGPEHGRRSEYGYNDYGPPRETPHMPPTEKQHFGPEFEDENREMHRMAFQYSQCNGRKKALCIGINYFGQEAELKGCINDARHMQRFLIENYGYSRENIVMLTDDQEDPRSYPTKENIIRAMQWLVDGAQPHDSLFFHYSGHGGQTKDLVGDEQDGYDEVIYPVDFQGVGHLVDDTMHQILVTPLPAGCRLTSIFDSCHSGSALDLPYMYSTEGKIKEPNLLEEAREGLLSAFSSYTKRGGQLNMRDALETVGGLITGYIGARRADERTKRTKTSPADVISWSGCKDSQTSADAVEAGAATGAMSYAFISTLTERPQQSYQQLLNSVREILRSKYSQKPQLSSSHPMDTDIMFIC